jgi:uncharacterized protein YcfJ
MVNKTLIWIGVFIGSTIGSVLGAWVSHGDLMSWQSLVFTIVGGFAGIYAGYKLSDYI